MILNSGYYFEIWLYIASIGFVSLKIYCKLFVFLLWLVYLCYVNQLKAKEMGTNYNKQATDFAKKHGVKLSFIGRPQYKIHFAGDKVSRYVFKCRLSRGGSSYTFDFGQSLNNRDAIPTMYDILACLQKYDVGSFEDFCGEFGYDTDSRQAEKIYKAVCREFEAIYRLFSDVIEELQEIQ